MLCMRMAVPFGTQPTCMGTASSSLANGLCRILPTPVVTQNCLHWNVMRRLKRHEKRREIFIATKFGFSITPDRVVNGSPEYAAQEIERSLTRLGVDCIDLYYLHRCACRAFESVSVLISCHRPDPEVPIEVCMRLHGQMIRRIERQICEAYHRCYGQLCEGRQDQISRNIRVLGGNFTTRPCRAPHLCSPDGIFGFLSRY